MIIALFFSLPDLKFVVMSLMNGNKQIKKPRVEFDLLVYYAGSNNRY